LVDELSQSLESVFTRNFLEALAAKLKRKWGKPEDYHYLEVKVHRVAKWWTILKAIKERGYVFDLRFKTDLEEFAWIVLFVFALETLLEKGAIPFKEQTFVSRLKSDQFDDYLYELLIAANYVSLGYDVEFPELSGETTIDVVAKRDLEQVFIQCKMLRSGIRWDFIAAELLRRLHKNKMNIAIEIELSKLPEKPMQFVDTLWKLIRDEEEVSGVKLQKFNLPYIVEHKLTIPFSFTNTIYICWGLTSEYLMAHLR